MGVVRLHGTRGIAALTLTALIWQVGVLASSVWQHDELQHSSSGTGNSSGVPADGVSETTLSGGSITLLLLSGSSGDLAGGVFTVGTASGAQIEAQIPSHLFGDSNGGCDGCNGTDAEERQRVVIAVYSGEVAQAVAAVALAASGEGEADLASAVVDVLLPGLGGENTTQVVVDSVPFNITMVVNPIPFGGGTCVQPPLFSSSEVNSTCVAGCCEDSLCNCRGDEYRGALCDRELLCHVIGSVKAGNLAVDSVCHSERRGGNLLVCACSQIGQVAVFAHRILPANNLRFTPGVDLLAAANERPFTVALLTLFALGYLCCALLSLRLDNRTLYLSEPPPWMQPGPRGWTFGMTLLFNFRTLQSVLRLIYVAPAYTVHTRVELVHCFALYLVLSACVVLTFVGNRQCTTEQALSVAVLSAVRRVA